LNLGFWKVAKFAFVKNLQYQTWFFAKTGFILATVS